MVLPNTKQILCLIGARGGSKSIPRKNIKDFLGKPLIHWTIDVAQRSGVMTRVVLSTDDQEIADVGRRVGVEVPFLRPSEFAQDQSSALSYITHAVAWLREQQGFSPDAVVLLEPTSPCRQPFHIRGAVDLFFRAGADSVVGVSEVPSQYHPNWQFVIQGDSRLRLFAGVPIRDIVRRRQDLLPKTYYRNGAIYVFRPQLLLSAQPSIYGEHCLAYPMDPQYAIDINTPEDWAVAEAAFRRLTSLRAS